jgi:hypothetical protein
MPVVTSVEQLNGLVRTAPPLVPGRSVRLELPDLEPAETKVWEKRLSRAYGACGCKSGALLLAVFLVIYLAALWMGMIELSLGSVIWLVAGCLIASAVGKLAGLGLARVGLRLTVRRLQSELLRRG